MAKSEVTTDLFLAVLDFWELKGGEKINPELADIIELHLDLAYTCGAESVIEKIKETIATKANKAGQLPISYIKMIL